MRETSRMQAVQSPIIPTVARMIKNHPGTISLGQGVVYYGPPQQVIDRANLFLKDSGNHQYNLVQGIPQLIEVLEAKLRNENGISGNYQNRIVITAGANMAFVNAMLAITSPGDEIILPLPFYFNHEMAIAMADCKAVLVPTDENYQLRLEAMREAITPRTRAIVTVSPNNPSGAVYSQADLRGINEICRAFGIYHISDEAYEYFTYDGIEHFSPGSIPGSESYTISLFSLSKSYGFAGWRIGYMVIPEHLFSSICKIQDTILICPPVVSQYAALGALEAGADYCREQLQSISEVRKIVFNELQQIKELCSFPLPNGAFYYLIRINTALDPIVFVERLIREYGVAAIPGSTFGMQDCCLRVSYGALERDTVQTGVGRLVKGIKGIVEE
jgi:aspartate/methionine/tyrosine aminotransferase